MTDTPSASSAGALLRAARERQGLAVAALAATVKVTPRKVEALEADRYGELPDLTFARALAATICRVLGADPAPVLALLPQPPSLGPGLEQVHNGLNAPLRSRTERLPAGDASVLKRPAVWLPALVLLAALAVWWLPQSWIGRARLAVGASPPAVVAPPVVEAPLPPAPSVAADEPASAAEAPSELLRLQARADAWVEVLDAGGAIVIQRLVRAGETVGLDATPPLRVKVGNASAVSLDFRGRPVDLAASARDNVARLELK